MRLFLFSDLHCDIAAAKRLVNLANDADVVIGAGDFASVRRGLRESLSPFKDLPVPLVLVAGNNETTDELLAVCSGWPNTHILHGSSLVIQGQTFFGLGGGVPVTPFGDWSYDFSEEEAAQLLATCPSNAVLVSHSPPKGAVDVSSRGTSIGSTAVRDTVLRCSPRLVVCGHIHASAGRSAMLGNSPVINAGPAGIFYSLETTPA